MIKVRYWFLKKKKPPNSLEKRSERAFTVSRQNCARKMLNSYLHFKLNTQGFQNIFTVFIGAFSNGKV